MDREKSSDFDRYCVETPKKGGAFQKSGSNVFFRKKRLYSSPLTDAWSTSNGRSVPGMLDKPKQVAAVEKSFRVGFYVTGAGDRMVLEDRNVSLRGRCKESDTLSKSWQAQYSVDVAKTLAGVCHSKDCVLRDRRRESAPWMLCFEVEGLDS